MLKPILILDDDPARHAFFDKALANRQLVHVWTANEALKAVKNQTFGAWFLDHDLGEFDGNEVKDIVCRCFQSHVGFNHDWTNGNSGWHFAQSVNLLFTKEHLDNPRVIVHSHNPVGAANMAKELREVGLTVIVAPFRVFELKV